MYAYAIAIAMVGVLYRQNGGAGSRFLEGYDELSEVSDSASASAIGSAFSHVSEIGVGAGADFDEGPRSLESPSRKGMDESGLEGEDEVKGQGQDQGQG